MILAHFAADQSRHVGPPRGPDQLRQNTVPSIYIRSCSMSETWFGMFYFSYPPPAPSSNMP